MSSIPGNNLAREWDIFCRVVDNFGDVGVCWRLAADLAQRGHAVRLLVDDPEALRWMAPIRPHGVTVTRWAPSAHASASDVVVCGFACDLDDAAVEAIASRYQAGQPCAWINLEYLTAETFPERAHGKLAPVLRGPAAGVPRYVFYPGFTPATGGLLREPDLLRRQAQFDRGGWLERLGITWWDQTLMSMFCYEPPRLPALIDQLAHGDRDIQLLVCAGRGADAVRRALPGSPKLSAVRTGRLTVTFLPFLSQHEFDHLLWSCDLNFVRGEDSMVRAIWAGRPFVWQIYAQKDRAHLPKLQALLDRLQAPTDLRRLTAQWNGDNTSCGPLDVDVMGALGAWAEPVRTWREALLRLPDMTTQLIQFVAQSH